MSPLFDAFLDDAAVFPPGNLPLLDAVVAHRGHEQQVYSRVVGPFVLGAKDLAALRTATAGFSAAALPLSLVASLPQCNAALTEVQTISAVRLVALEISVPEHVTAGEVAAALGSVPAGLEVYVEIPRDGRRDPILAALSGTGHCAKFRTGGVTAELYPDEAELAGSIVAAVRAAVPFKATAGLHHAVRNTDADRGFEQHGFLNMLIAAAAAQGGAHAGEVAGLLGERDPRLVADAVRVLGPSVRTVFRSMGTCSISEPVGELVDLGLLPADYRMEEHS